MLRNRFHSQGITWIEFLIVAAILVLLFALLIPAVARVRDEALRTTFDENSLAACRLLR